MGRPKRYTSRYFFLRSVAGKVAALVLVAAVVGGIVLGDRLGLFGQASKDDFEKYHGQTFHVVHVVDGDTLDLQVWDSVRNEDRTRIRLWGIDTPETVKPNSPVEHFGPESSHFARELTLGRNVRIELDEGQDNRDRYDRLLAYVYLPDGRCLNALLIEQGYGYADPRFAHRDKRQYNRLMRQAMAERRGLWRDVTQDNLPYYYREQLRLPAERGVE